MVLIQCCYFEFIFKNSCQERVKNCMPSSLCPSVHAYISKCDIAGIAIEPSEKLG